MVNGYKKASPTIFRNAGEIRLRVKGASNPFSEKMPTLASELCVSPYATVEVLGSDRSKYTNAVIKTKYRVVGSNDMIVVNHLHDAGSHSFHDVIEVRRNEFNCKKSFADKVKSISLRYALPEDLCFALGQNEEIYPVFLQLVINSNRYVDSVTEQMLKTRDIAICKKGLLRFFWKENGCL